MRLLYFGFIYRGKGIEDLLDALALLQEEPDTRDRVRLTLAGGAAPDIAFGRSGSYLDSLRQRAIRLGLRRNMLDWRLNLPAEQIPALIQAHHTMVLPYRESRKLAWLGQMRGTSGALSAASGARRGLFQCARLCRRSRPRQWRSLSAGRQRRAGLDAARPAAGAAAVGAAQRQRRRTGRGTRLASVAARFRRLFEAVLTERGHD